jgi:hypothetical protein
MHPAIDELQKAKEYGPSDRRLSPSRPVFEGREDGQNGNGTKNDEDDFRIMQHFVRDLIGGPEDRDPL